MKTILAAPDLHLPRGKPYVHFRSESLQHPDEALMTTITLPPDIEEPLAKEAKKHGSTPESLAIESLRKLFVSPLVKEEQAQVKTLFDLLSGYVGTVDGTEEALSENCGQRFAEELAGEQRPKRP
jgi:hypothetical protein